MCPLLFMLLRLIPVPVPIWPRSGGDRRPPRLLSGVQRRFLPPGVPPVVSEIFRQARARDRSEM